MPSSSQKPTQQALPLGEAQGSFEERKRLLGLALLKVGCDKHLASLVEWVFAITHGGREGTLKKTYRELAGTPWGLCCSERKAYSVVSLAIREGLLTKCESRYYTGSQGANEYEIHWPGVQRILGVGRLLQEERKAESGERRATEEGRNDPAPMTNEEGEECSLDYPVSDGTGCKLCTPPCTVCEGGCTACTPPCTVCNHIKEYHLFNTVSFNPPPPAEAQPTPRHGPPTNGRENQKREVEDFWKLLERELQSCGVTDASAALKQARVNGLAPQAVRAILGHFQAHPGHWQAGALHYRIRTGTSVLGPAEGWPPPTGQKRRSKPEPELRVVALVAEGKRRGLSDEQIREALEGAGLGGRW